MTVLARAQQRTIQNQRAAHIARPMECNLDLVYDFVQIRGWQSHDTDELLYKWVIPCQINMENAPTSQNSTKDGIYMPVMKLFEQPEFKPYVLCGFLITAVLKDKFLARFNELGGT